MFFLCFIPTVLLFFGKTSSRKNHFCYNFYTLYTSYIYDVKAHVCCNYCKMLILRRLDFAELVLFHYSSNLLEILQYWLYCHYKSSLLNKNISWGLNFKGKIFDETSYLYLGGMTVFTPFCHKLTFSSWVSCTADTITPVYKKKCIFWALNWVDV